jgi:RHS repeat-associated protein
MTVPLFTSPGRSGFGPQLSLSYDSGAGNGPFGIGWNLSLPSITRRSDRGLPKYLDAEESDVFIISGAEDLVPVLIEGNNGWERQELASPTSEPGYVVRRYRPRIEGLFARIERWTEKATGISHWRSISKDNITTLYGKQEDARIADPADRSRVFAWLICESHDDKGNASLYRYKPEDGANVDRTALYERKRLLANQFPQRYLKTIRYGNRTPRQPGEDLTLRNDWLFELLFDYGEHDEATPTTTEARQWPVRQDPFSLFRSTFDIRTYRLCRRVLMFHHFPGELNATADYLVRSTDLEYKESAVASFVASITRAGYAQKPDGTYVKKALPKLEFKYSEVAIDETVHEIDAESIKNLPSGVEGARYQWIDLDSEGLTGVLTEQADALYYKHNLGNGTFGPLEKVTSQPSVVALSGGRQHLLDLAGEGHLDLVEYDGPTAGFYKRHSNRGWGRFTPFKSLPSINTRDPNLRFLDLTGDGFPDILISGDTVFTWYESLAKEGFAPAKRSPKSRDEENGPKLIFSDPTQSIFLADMVGDGLADIVRVRFSDVCYWPNLGYGRFGAKVTMGNAPVFESQDLFDARRVSFGDFDGSGNSDMMYVGRDGISLYFNQSGNSWSPLRRLSHFPRVDSLTAIAAVDLLGNGTACLVWSSPLASDAHSPMRYIDLMGGQKPHLLVYATNNMGSETEVHYKASTQFYLQDQKEGRLWVTKLPFPIHVIARTENRDLVSNTRLVSTFRYRHGFYDGVEREFRGFAHVEQRDADSVVGEFDLPPVVTKTWFHNGAYLKEKKLEAYFKDPANQEFFSGDAQAAFLPDSDLPPNLNVDEMREAARALKGSILRQEIYAEDRFPRAALPYSVSERSYKLACLQPQGPNRHAVFFAHPSETLDYHYERNPTDPRISHALTLAVDDYGNVLKSAAIGYQRRVPVFDEQKKTLATLTESQYTNAILEDDSYRTPLTAEVKTYELTAPALTGQTPLAFATVDSIATAASEIPYEAQAAAGQTQKRLIEQLRTIYRKNDLSICLPLGTIDSMALPCQSYKLAFTPGLLDVFQSKASRADLTNILTGGEGGYRALDGEGRLWIPSGQAFYSPNPGDSAPQELAFATAHFFLPHRFQDPFGNNTVVAYDSYNLLLVSTRDAVGNENLADYDYRVLQPKMMADPNDNHMEAQFDALGMLAGTAVSGKALPDGRIEGDSFNTFTPDLTPKEIAEFFDAPDPGQLAIDHLGTATTRILYDLERVPVCAASIAREAHVSDLPAGTKVQLHFVYSDGFGREAQTKVQAGPGPRDPGDPNSPLFDPRWVGTGEKIYNNKGKPIRQYEPFFSPTPQFGIETWGVSNTLFYDPLERVVATLHPNDTFEKVVFDPWHQTAFDVTDTVLLDPRTDVDVGEFFGWLPAGQKTWYQQRIDDDKGPEEQAAAEKAAKHADTATVLHFDGLGRPFLSIADNGEDENGNALKFHTRTVLDIEGNQREVVDTLDRVVMRYDYDMLGMRIHQVSMEAGERWLLNEVTGKPIRAWNSRKYEFRTEYDALRRPLQSFVQGGDPSEPNAKLFPQPIVYERAIYGENAETGLSKQKQQEVNLRGKVFARFDGAGVAMSYGADPLTQQPQAYDFKGNLLRSTRQFLKDYKNPPDWSQNPELEDETFTNLTAYDALNRPVTVTTPDNSVYRPRFNEANLLEKIDVDLQGGTSAPFVKNIDYNAKGQRTRIDYGNGVTTAYAHDPLTFRLTHLLTSRDASAFPEDCPQSPPQDWPGCQAQNLSYIYDPVGNITKIRDDAQQTIYFRNKRVEPSAEYTYDPIYRLIAATGREHLGQNGAPVPLSYNESPRVGLQHPGDGNTMGLYLQRYIYDAVGNFEQMIHSGSDPNKGWRRTYSYQKPSLLEPGKMSNRLTSTTVGNGNPGTEQYGYDAHGNMLQMPQLQIMRWDFNDQLQMTQRQAVNTDDEDGLRHQGERTYYVYDATGQRVRKVTESQAAAGQTPARTKERIYLEGYEVYREYDADGSTVSLERETLHVMGDKQRIALVERRTEGIDNSLPQLIRYQFGNHLGSATLELDNQAQVISYEEYFPYGSTSYQAVRSQTETPKRYRYTDKERDEETKLYYFGQRYAAAWLGRWVSADPAMLRDGLNLYAFTRDNPVTLLDLTGMDSSSLADDLRSVVYDRHAKGLNATKLVADETNKMIIQMFEWLGEQSFGATCSKTTTELEDFDRGVEVFSDQSGLDFWNEIRSGEEYREEFRTSKERRYSDNFLIGGAIVPFQGTSEQHEGFLDARNSYKLYEAFGFKTVSDEVIGSMGLEGPDFRGKPLRSYSPEPVFLSPPSPPRYTKIGLTEGGTGIPYGLQGTAENAGDFRGLTGADPLEVVRRVPESWLVDDARKQYDRGREKPFWRGIKFSNPSNPEHNRVRIQPGRPGLRRGHIEQRGPYLRWQNSGFFDAFGNKGDKGDKSTHIPLRGNPALKKP